MVSSQLVVLLAGAALSVNAQNSKATLYNFQGLPLDEKATATVVGSNSVGTTYVFACNTAAAGAAFSSAAGAVSSALSAGGSVGSLVSSAAAAGSSVGAALGSSIANEIKSQIPNVELTPMPKPTNKAARDIRLTPIPKPTAHARRQLPDLSIPCIPYTVVQGSEIYGVKAEVTAPIKFYGEFNATWKGDIKSAKEVTGTFTMGGDITALARSAVDTAAPSDVFDKSIEVPVVTAAPNASSSGAASSSGSQPSGTGANSGSASPSGTSAPAKNSNPAAAGPLPTGAVAYFGAAAGLLGAVLVL